MVALIGKGGQAMPEHIDDPISKWEDSEENSDLQYRALPGQIPDPTIPDLTAPSHDGAEVDFDIVEPGHDEGSYGEHLPRS